MRITFIGHASLLIEANGLSIVSDPWWNGPCFGAQWWPHPMPHVEAVRDRRVDYVYVSHGHHDQGHRVRKGRGDLPQRARLPERGPRGDSAEVLKPDPATLGTTRLRVLPSNPWPRMPWSSSEPAATRTFAVGGWK
jgi:hypothetical protein